MTVDTLLSGTEIANAQLQVQNYISLWRVTRVDGVKEYYTSHDEDISVPILEKVSNGSSGITAGSAFGLFTFKASTGFTASASRREVGLRSQNFSVIGLIGDLDLTKLEGGRYDLADVTGIVQKRSDTAGGNQQSQSHYPPGQIGYLPTYEHQD